MKLHDYLESTYVRTNIALQQGYSPYGQGKCLATQGLINAQRRVMTWANYPVLLFHYLLVLCHVVKAPLSAHDLVESLKMRSAEAAKKANDELEEERQTLIRAEIEAEIAAQKGNA